MLYIILFQVYLIVSAKAWDTEQLEVFDAIDEIKENFYDLLNVSKEAENHEIKSAFRTLSLKLHPDKSKYDSSEEFRNLVTVYDILKNPKKRKYYNDVLINGLPNWKSGIFYYRYVRKMGLVEVMIIIFVITTIGQYLVNWGVYLEKKLTIEDQMNRNRKAKHRIKMEEEKYIVPKPSVFDTLPIQIPKLIWFLIVSIPACFRLLSSSFQIRIKRTREVAEIVPESIPTKPKTARKRNKFIVPEGPNFEVQYNESMLSDTSAPPVSGGLWTDEDLVELIKMVNKYSQGTAERWEKIASSLNRSIPEVTYMANKMKKNGYKLLTEKDEIVVAEKVKQKTKKQVEIDPDVLNWNQIQQKRLEEALLLFPKGSIDRWDRISEHVPEKSKDECMQRFRYIAEDLKKRKQKDTGGKEEDPNITTN